MTVTMPLVEQRMAALRMANDVRLTNARVRRQVGMLGQRDGMLAVADLLERLDPSASAMPISRLLRSVHRLGDRKARRLLNHAGIVSGDRRVDQLTVRQRACLATALRHPTMLWPSTVLRSAA